MHSMAKDHDMNELQKLRNKISDLEKKIDRQRKMEEVLKESEEKYRNLFENAIDPIFIVDAESNYIEVNKRAVEVFGYSKKEFLKMSIFDVIPGEQLYDSEKELGKLRSNGSYVNFMGKMKTKDGDWLDVEVNSSAMFKDGKMIGSRDIVRDITNRRNINKQLECALNEKEMIMKEVYRQIKNNLTVLSHMIGLQSEYISNTEAIDVLKKSETRVNAISLINKKIFHSNDLKSINFADYIQELSGSLIRKYQSKTSSIDMRIEAPDGHLGFESVVPCALIVNELISNALQHAFPDRKKGEISVRFGKTKGTCNLVIGDDGIGFPRNIDLRRTDTLGFLIVNSSAEKLGADIQLNRGDGTEFNIEFKEKGLN
jgi:PAS domain S-box-containing protein